MTARVFALVVLLRTSTAMAAQTVPDPVRWVAATEAPAVRPGGALTVRLAGDVRDGWHLYGLADLPGGPIATRITVAPAATFVFSGAINASKPHTVFDPNFDMKVELYSGRAEFQLPLRVSAQAAPGEQMLTVSVRYQSCSDTLCLAPRTAQVSVPVQVR